MFLDLLDIKRGAQLKCSGQADETDESLSSRARQLGVPVVPFLPTFLAGRFGSPTKIDSRTKLVPLF